MKIRTLVTISNGKGNGRKPSYLPPGEVDLPDDEAQRLINLGMAKTIAQVQAEADAKVGEVTVTQAKGPSINLVSAVPAAAADAGEAKPADQPAKRGSRGAAAKAE